jgi:hypothetical protein
VPAIGAAWWTCLAQTLTSVLRWRYSLQCQFVCRPDHTNKFVKMAVQLTMSICMAIWPTHCQILWNVTPCRLVNSSRRFERWYCLRNVGNILPENYPFSLPAASDLSEGWLRNSNKRSKVCLTRSRNHCCSVKAISITYSECVSVALVMQHVKRMRRIILSSVACLAVPYFSTLSHKRHDFGGNVTEHKMCVWILCTIFVCNISHSNKNSARYYHKCT